MKQLVAYFSCSGVTKRVASKIADTVGADEFEIVPKTAYTARDLDWMDKHSRSTLEMDDPDCRPQIEGRVDIAEYDVIYLGFPIWWYVAPRIIQTFLESYDFGGKKVVVFFTSGGSGAGKTYQLLKRSATGAEIIEGGRLSAVASDADIARWISSLKMDR